jgi:multisubunit Na+/H+ antiporter MnhE subunit
MIRVLLALALLTAVYVATLATDDPLDIVVGAAIAAAVLAVSTRWTRRLHGPEALGDPGPRGLGRAMAAIPFAGAVAAEVAIGTWQVSLIVLGIRPLRRPGLLELPIGERTPRGVAVFAMAIGLSPGTLLVDVDEERGVLVLHTIDLSDPAGLRVRLERLYTRWQRPVVP